MGFPNISQQEASAVGHDWVGSEMDDTEWFSKMGSRTRAVFVIGKTLIPGTVIYCTHLLFFVFVCPLVFSSDDSSSDVGMQRWREAVGERERERIRERGGVLQDVINILPVWPGATAHVRLLVLAIPLNRKTQRSLTLSLTHTEIIIF